jgi:hypothetical protein
VIESLSPVCSRREKGRRKKISFPAKNNFTISMVNKIPYFIEFR